MCFGFLPKIYTRDYGVIELSGKHILVCTDVISLPRKDYSIKGVMLIQHAMKYNAQMWYTTALIYETTILNTSTCGVILHLPPGFTLTGLH